MWRPVIITLWLRAADRAWRHARALGLQAGECPMGFA
jgi:hypothetical protein